MQDDGKVRNLVTDVIDAHRVHRNYLDKEVPAKLLERILMSAIRSPSSMNGQHVSYIVVCDRKRREKIAAVAGNNPHIARAPAFILFVMDYLRAKKACEMHSLEMQAQDSFESLMVGSVDVGLALSAAITTAESLGLNVCPIGGVRTNPKEISRLFELPQHVFGVVGLTVGYAEDTLPLKPRFPYRVLVNHNTYDAEGVAEAVKAFDTEMVEYARLVAADSTKPTVSWSERMSNAYKTIPYPEVKAGLRAQGFKTSK